MEDNELFSVRFLRLIKACSCCCCSLAEEEEDVISRSLLLVLVVMVAVDEHPKLVSMAVACCLKSAAWCDVNRPLSSSALT